MSHDYQAFADAAQEHLSAHIRQRVNRLMDHLILNAESSEYVDELYCARFIYEVAENQYRMDLWSDEVRIVEVTSQSQIDHQETPEFTVTHAEFATWCDSNGLEDKDPECADDLVEYLKSEVGDWSCQYTLLGEYGEAEMGERDVYEYWLVDDYAKRELESVGEQVVEIYDLLVWCRTCTGQSKWYDSPLQALGERYLAK